MKTVYIIKHKNEKKVIEFSKFVEITRNGTFIIGLPYEKNKRTPYGIYGYFQDLQEDGIVMLAKSFNITKEWRAEADQFKKEFEQMKLNDSTMLDMVRKNYKRYLIEVK